jgi:hypothetical protein
VLALRHIYDAFAKTNETRLHTRVLLNLMAERDDGPWAKKWDRDLRFDEIRKPASDLARILREFEVYSTDLKIDNENKKGYRKEDFTNAWLRYDIFESPNPPDDATQRYHATEQVRVGKTGSVQGSGSVNEQESGSLRRFVCANDYCNHERYAFYDLNGKPCVHCPDGRYTEVAE